MRIRWVAARFSIAVFVTISMLGALLIQADASSAQGVDASLCTHDGDRLSVPTDFFLDTCFDGDTLTLLNRSDLVVDVLPSGQWSVIETFTENAPPPAIAFGAFLRGSTVLPPGHGVRLRVGSGSLDVRLQGSELGGDYGVAASIYEFIPALPATIAAFDAGVDFYYEIDAVAKEYNSCLGRNNFIGDIGCGVNLNWDINFAVGRLAKTVGVESIKELIGPIASLVEVGLFTDRVAGDALDFANAAKELRISEAVGAETAEPETPPEVGPGLPTITSFDVNISGQKAQIEARIGWSDSAGPVTCTVWVDNEIVLEQVCGTAPSLQRSGLAPGEHIFRLRICDAFGNCAESPVVRRTVASPVDPSPPTPPVPTTPPPAAPVIASFDAIVRGGGSVQMAGQIGWEGGTDPITCTFFVDGGVVLNQQCGVSPSYTLTVSPGAHSFQLRICNRLGSCTSSATINRSL